MSRSALKDIIELKKKEVEQLRRANLTSNLDFPQRHRLRDALREDRLSLIAEVKKASPSKGIIRAEFDPVKIAMQFEEKGARAVSVLTEQHYFLGAPDYLTAIAHAIQLPILRKDFIIDPIQIKETVAMGANAVLLICSILSSTQLQELYAAAIHAHLDVLVEVHDEDELAMAHDVDAEIIGINNRNLKTFQTDSNWAETVILKDKESNPERLYVAESGYSNSDQLASLDNSGVHGVLIGEGLATHPELLDYFNA